MKLLIKMMKRNKWIFLLTMLFCGMFSHVEAMKRPFKGSDEGSALKKQKTEKQIQDELQQHVTGLKADEFFVFQEGTADGIVISKSILELSETMKHLLEFVDSNNSNAQKLIPLPYSIGIIKIFFACLQEYAKDPSGLLIRPFGSLQTYHLSWLVDVINLAAYLDIVPSVQKSVNDILDDRLKNMDLSTMEKNMPVLNALNPDIRRQIVSQWVKPCIELMGSRLMLDQKKKLPNSFESGMYSPDGKIFIFKLGTKRYYELVDMRSKKIVIQKLKVPGDMVSADFNLNNNVLVIGYKNVDSDQGGFVVWNWNGGKLVKLLDVPLPDSLDVVKISPKGDLVAILRDDKIFLWDISDPSKVVSIGLKDKKYTGDDTFLAMAFCSDGKTLFTGCAGRLSEHGLIEWDVSNIHEIKRNELIGEHQQHINILSVACSADGKMYASGAEGEKDNLLLWDNASHDYYVLQGHSTDVDCLVFTQDNKILISESDSDKTNNFIVWDIRDVKAIARYYLPGYSSFLPHSMMINGNNIICEDNDGKKYVIPVLSSSQLLLLDTFKECDFMQAQVIVRIIQQVKAGLPVRFNDQELKVFMTLPKSIRDLMQKFFNISIK